MGMQPPAPPPGASDDPGWHRDRSPYAHGPSSATPPGGPGWSQPQDAPPGYGPPPGYRQYGQPGFGAFGAPVDHPQGTTILVLGILSLAVCGLLGPFAWVMGSKALKEIDLDPVHYRNRGNVVAGKILGIISSALLILGAVLFVAVIALAIAADA